MKQEIIDCLFANDKFDARKLKLLSDDQVMFLYSETANCLSPYIKDRVYWLMNDISDYRSCNHCGNPIVKFISVLTDKTKDHRHCSNKCRLSDPSFKQGMIAKYGVDNARKVELFNVKIRSTNLKKYGTEYPAHTEKGIQTNLKKYGVRHPMQNFKIFQKVMRSRFRIKKYITNSGNVINYQGYEDVVLKFLLDDLEIPEDQIVTDRISIPKIFYSNPCTKKISRYYSDIWVKSHNLLIEVKSTFTYGINTEITLAKQAECKKQNINHIIVICSKTKILDIK